MSLEIIFGSMYSGKSTELMRRVTRLQSIGMKCLVINHTNDKRDGLQTHDGQHIKAIKTNEILLIPSKQYDVIAIDEAQFFSNLRVAVTLMVQNDKQVIVAGLNGDFKRDKFGEINDLIPFADDITFKKALCARCKHPSRLASFTKRIQGDNEIISTESTHIAVCRQCY